MGRRRRSKKSANRANSAAPEHNQEQNQLSQSCMPNPETAPWLMFCHRKNQKTLALYSAPEAKSYTRSSRQLVQQMSEFDYWTSPQGWILLCNRSSRDCFLLNHVSMMRVELPPLIHDAKGYLRKFVLSAPPTDSNYSILLLTSGGDEYFDLLFYHPNNHKPWVTYHPHLNLEEHEYHNSILDITACNGKFYGLLGGDKLVLIDPTNPSYLEVRPLILTDPTMPPGHKNLMHTCHLLESCGEVFLVSIQHIALPNVVHSILVYKMDLDNRVWNEMVDSFSGGDQVFFLSNKCSGSCSAHEKKMKGNRIYFFGTRCDPHLYIYDLDDRSISIKLPCPNLQSPWSAPTWLMPPM